MTHHVTCRPLKVTVAHDGKTADGFMICVDDALVAVVTHLERVAPDEPDDGWFLEAGFGPCEVAPASNPVFRSPDEARAWVLRRVERALRRVG